MVSSIVVSWTTSYGPFNGYRLSFSKDLYSKDTCSNLAFNWTCRLCCFQKFATYREDLVSFDALEVWFNGHNSGLLDSWAWAFIFVRMRVHNCHVAQGRLQRDRAAEVLEIQPWDLLLLGRPLLSYALKQQRYLVRASRSHVRDRCIEDVLAPTECARRIGGRRSNDRLQHMACAYAPFRGRGLLVSRSFLRY